MMSKQPGYILLLALMLTSMSVLLISTVLYKTSVVSRYALVYLQREKTQALARSGVELALSQINNLMPQRKKDAQEDKKKQAEEQKQEKNDKESKDDPRKEFFGNLFSIINRWQTFKINEDEFDVEGEIKIYIACEQGKINLARLYDFKKESFLSTNTINGQKIAELIFNKLGERGGKEKVVSAFEQFMKKRTYPLQDVSELLLLKELQDFKENLFPQPNEQPSAQETKKPLYLMDLFTLETQAMNLDPVVLSESVGTLLGFNRQSTVDGKKWVKDLPTGTADWSKDWDKVLSPLYKKEYKAIPDEIKSLFIAHSNPSIFSIIVHASIGKMTQKMYAIVHKDAKLNNYRIRKLYWLS